MHVPRRTPACLRMRGCAWRKGGFSTNHSQTEQKETPGTYPRITQRDGEAPQHILRIPEEHVRDAARKRIEADEAAKALRLGAPAGLAGHKVEQALDLDLDDRLDDRRVAVDEELAEHVGGAQHHVKVVAWEHVLDVPEDLVVVFLVLGEFRGALDVEVEQATWGAGNQRGCW